MDEYQPLHGGGGGGGPRAPMPHGQDWAPGLTPDALRGMFPNTAAVDAVVARFGTSEEGLNRAMVFLMESGEGSPRGGLAARGRGGGPDEDEDDTWEPMGATLGSRLHLGELDMLHKAGRHVYCTSGLFDSFFEPGSHPLGARFRYAGHGGFGQILGDFGHFSTMLGDFWPGSLPSKYLLLIF